MGHGRRVAVYYAWSRQAETSAPLGVIENRFPALFESRRILYPRYSELSDPARYDQGIGGHLDHFQRKGFVAFIELASSLTEAPVIEVERADNDGAVTPISGVLDAGVDTLVVISLDSVRTEQRAARTRQPRCASSWRCQGTSSWSPRITTSAMTLKRSSSTTATAPSRPSNASQVTPGRSSLDSACQ